MSNPALQNPQVLAQELVQAANSLSDQEATQRYQQILAQLPADQAAELNTLALNQVGATDRTHLARHFKQAHQDSSSPFDGYTYANDTEAASPKSLGQMSVRAQQQDPNLLGGILGNNSALGGQIGKAALAALAALLIRRMMSGQGMPGSGTNAGGDLGSVLGGLLGGGGFGSQSLPQQGQSVPGGDLGGLLGGLLGGGGGQNLPQRGQSVPGGDLGGLLGGLLGGGASQNLPQQGQSVPGGDLGGLLGGLLGGGAAGQYTSQGGGGLDSILSSILGGGSSPAPTPAQPGAGSHRKRVHLGEDT